MDRSELATTAELAHINLDDSELETLGQAVSQKIEYFEKMAEVDVEGLEPSSHAFLMHNRRRADKVASDDSSDRLLENAPELEDRFIVIPNVL